MKTLLPSLAGLAVLLASAAVPTAALPGSDDALILIAEPGSGTIRSLLEDGVPVVWNGGDFLVALASARRAAELAGGGLSARVIDPAIGDDAYYLVSPVPAERGALLSRHARVLWLDRGRAIVACPESGLDPVLGAGFDVARIFLEPVRPPRELRLPARAGREVLPVIEDIVAAVESPRIDAHVQRLQDFVTRYATRDSAYAAAAYIRSEFESFGIDSVYYHDFSPGTYSPNVIAVIPGTSLPDEIIVVGGHYDSYARPSVDDAPGADDNASGTSMVLECARVLAPYRLVRTIMFMAFGAEELGLIGSRQWVQQVAQTQELNVVAMLNADMIGYSSGTLDLSLISEPSYTALRDLMVQVGNDYVPGLPLEINGSIPGGTSDHASFWNGGYHAIMFFEDSFAPFGQIHTPQDVVGLGYNSPQLAFLTTQLGAAFLATMAEPFRLSVLHIPLSDTEDTENDYRVVARLISPLPLDPDSLYVQYAVNGFEDRVMLTPTGEPDEYEAYIPAQVAGHFVDYYIVAGDTEGGRVTEPENAPAETHRFFVGVITVVFEDDFEIDRGWDPRRPGDDATTGIWIRVDPNGTWAPAGEIQPENDHTPGGFTCYVTGNAPRGTQIGEQDVDGGHTTLLSPLLDLSGVGNARLSYYRWYANSIVETSGTDEWLAEVSADSGATWLELERVGENQRAWNRVEIELADVIPLTDRVFVRFIASDEGGEDIVEAAIDDFAVRSYQEPPVPIEPWPPQVPPPAGARLVQVLPNPYGPSQAIRFNVPPPARAVTLRIFDLAGRVVATLVDEPALAGAYAVRWDGRDPAGVPVPSGTYFARLLSGGDRVTSKFVMVR